MKTVLNGKPIKRQINKAAKFLISGMVLAGTYGFAGSLSAKGMHAGSVDLVVQANKAMVMSEKIGKDYLYIGNKIATRAASMELKKALAGLQKNYAYLEKSINHPETKNLLTFVNMSYESLQEAIKQPYTLDNAQMVLDYTTMVTEGMAHIADLEKGKMKSDAFAKLAGANPLIEAVAKYYMAYQAGIKDDNTVAIMKETVEKVDKHIQWRTNYPKNNVSMNQIMTKVQRLWKVVKKFYLNIDEGGLPFIVYKTADDIGKNLMIYNTMFIKIQKERAKAGK